MHSIRIRTSCAKGRVSKKVLRKKDIVRFLNTEPRTPTVYCGKEEYDYDIH